jgi:hypothetical protein
VSTPDPTATPFSLGTPARLTRVVVFAGLMAGATLLLYADQARPSMDLVDVVAETILIDILQPRVWAIGIVFAAVATLIQKRRRGVLTAAWMGTLAILMGFRELDLHVLLNPGNIHHLGLDPEHAVRFRIDWWLDDGVPAGLKAVWAVLLLTPVLLLGIPFALARFPWVRAVRHRHPFACLVVGGFALIAAGYATDDILLRLWETHPGWVNPLEEAFEGLGQLLICAAIVLLAVDRARLDAALPAPRPVQ